MISFDTPRDNQEHVDDSIDQEQAVFSIRATDSHHQAFRALGDTNFRLYLFGLVLSQVGTYMQLVAEGWLVYRLTNSAFTLGLVGFIAMIPLAPWMLVAGALADRLSRQTLLGVVQLAEVVPPLALALLTLTNQVQVWHVVVIDLAMGFLSAVDQPARQALIAEAAQPENLDDAIALSSAGINIARVVGPAVGGLLVAIAGEAICFAANGISFFAVAAALVAMRLPKHTRIAQESMRTSLMDGGRYLLRERTILSLIGLVAIINLFLVPYQTILPVIARDILSAGATGLGFLTAAAGIGAIVGSLGVAHFPKGHRGLLTVLMGIGASIILVGFARSRDLWLACLILALLSSGIVAAKVLALTFVQSRVSDLRRGRILAAFILFDAGVPRLGGLAAGTLAALLGPTTGLELAAVGCLVCTLGLSTIAPQLRQLP